MRCDDVCNATFGFKPTCMYFWPDGIYTLLVSTLVSAIIHLFFIYLLPVVFHDFGEFDFYFVVRQP